MYPFDTSLADSFVRAFDLLGLFFGYAPYWGPFVLGVLFWHAWIRYVRANFIANQQYTLLEIRLPHEVMKSPAAMQAVFDGLNLGGGESTFIDRLWLGKVRTWYSFEYVSFEGQVHFYVWTRAALRRFVERTIYAHYPDTEIVPVEDYAARFPFSLDTHNVFGLDYKLKAAIGVPIRTYTDYGLDATQPKEEQKVDPLNHVLEFLGSLGKGEYAWIQILCRAHKKEDLTFGTVRNEKDYAGIAMDEVKRIRGEPEETVVFPDGKSAKMLSDRQRKRIEAINRNLLTSSQWDVGIRSIYLAEHEHFDGTNISGLIALWQPFNAPGYNGIGLDGSRWQPIFDYPWQDYNGMRETKMKVRIVDAYRLRSWFHHPYKFRHFMLTSEELATIFHIPGTVAKTPTLQRITSTRGQAPANLPL